MTQDYEYTMTQDYQYTLTQDNQYTMTQDYQDTNGEDIPLNVSSLLPGRVYPVFKVLIQSLHA